tara:strand:- start:108 stop:938 length:831 start_codon:yes stop_codon:yes gene_type:complete
MKKTLYFLITISLFSCDKDDTTTNGVPSYIQIDEITLDEDYTTNITDAWVYIDGVNKGVYELPAHFPVINDGAVEVRIYAGIKDNGIASQRVTYPFYHSYTSTEKLTIDSTTIIIPSVVLKENIEVMIEDFNQSYNFNHDTCFSVSETEGPYGNYGSLSFLDSIFVTEINYKDHPLSFDNVPQQGSATYLELDYKSDSEFLVGMYINFPNTPTLQKDLLWINPKDDWNKIYVNLTQTVSEAIGAESFSVFIRMQRDNFSEVKTLDFDNLRIVHYKK